MIKIKISKDQITVSGHALYDEYGKDIVCASVSSIVITSVNACLSFDNNALNYETNEGYINISNIKHTKEIDIILKNMINMLKELENDYKKNIKIYEEVQ